MDESGYELFKLPYDDKEMYSITGLDINRMIVITKTMLKMKPHWNERLMEFLARLHELEPSEKCGLEDIMREVGITPASNDNER